MSEIAVIERGELLPTIAELIEVIVEEHAAAKRAADDMVAHAIRAGHALLALRAQTPRGEWQKALKDHPGPPPSMAQTYMRIAFYESAVGHAPTINAAMKWLTGAPPADVNATASTPRLIPSEIERLFGVGMTATQIAEVLGASTEEILVLFDPARKLRHAEKARVRAQRAAKARQIQRKHERALAAERAGGGINAAFKQVRSTQIALDNLAETGATIEIRQAATLAYRAVCRAEDEIAKILNLA